MTDVQTRTGAGLPSEEPMDGAPMHGEPQRGEPQRGEPNGSGSGAPRRSVLMGAGALGATAFLAACGTSPGGSTYGTNPNGSDYDANPAPAGSKGANTTGEDEAGGTAAGGAVLAAADDVPQGGGIIKGDYVITQPTTGKFKAFSKVCTHQGCDVNKIDGGVIRCPCHGSEFSIEDGSVQGGPARKPLPETKVKLSGTNVVKV
jgi:Rieske Fe-S protein